jgi:hypothetical protein
MTGETKNTALGYKKHNKIRYLQFDVLISLGAALSVRHEGFSLLAIPQRQQGWRLGRAPTDALYFPVGPRCAPDLVESNAASRDIRADGEGAFSW